MSLDRINYNYGFYRLVYGDSWRLASWCNFGALFWSVKSEFYLEMLRGIIFYVLKYLFFILIY